MEFHHHNLINIKEGVNIPMPDMDQDIGEIELNPIGKLHQLKLTNINYKTSYAYSNAISSQLSLAKKKFTKKSHAIVHLAVPPLKKSSLIDFIYGNSPQIYYYLKKDNFTSLVLDIPYLKPDRKANNNNLVANISLPFLNCNKLNLDIIEKNPYWRNNIYIADSDEEFENVFIEFEMNEKINSMFNIVISQDFSNLIYFMMVESDILIQVTKNNVVESIRYFIPQSSIQKSNRLVFKKMNHNLILNGIKINKN